MLAAFRRCTFFLLCFLASAAASAQAPPKLPDYKKIGAALPPFALQTVAGKVITNASLPKGKPTVVMIFSPQCDHCERAMDTLSTLQPGIRSTQFVCVVEPRNADLLGPFMKRSGFDTTALFRRTGVDKGNLIYFLYRQVLLPQYNVYSAGGKLLKTFTGNTPIDSLRMYLK